MPRFSIEYRQNGNTLFSTDNEKEVMKWLHRDMGGEFVAVDNRTHKRLETKADVNTSLAEVPIVVPDRNVLPEDRV